ncbi:MAG: S-methyl-5-thioribose-1-phosphate isomerase [Rhodospirillaceae bacterium]|nr:S-methyl-5-thioribose-1-phosphate isomerase [Rhodospirillaceae bacterium]
MKIDGVPIRSIWPAPDGSVRVIDQTRLPFAFAVAELRTAEDAARAISAMVVRGAPLIGATAAYGLALAMRADPSDSALAAVYDRLLATRPTAVNLAWALNDMRQTLAALPPAQRADAGWRRAAQICDDDVAACAAIGRHGLPLIEAAWTAREKKGRVDILTHCNAGWLATVDWGTALAPIYMAHDAGVPVHVWVDETRPRNQGASLTAWELGRHGVPHTVIADNAGGHLMQQRRVDLCIVGTDRTTRRGDVCNKVGTYLKALAAHANNVPFYVAAPSSSIDWRLADGVGGIEIEERSPRELTHIAGRDADGRLTEVEISAPGSPALNIAFDVTPARLVTALITERGVCPATETGLSGLFPTQMNAAQ